MPLTIKRTNTVIAAANSVLFNGSNQCLTVPSNAAFNFGTGDFTLEAWVYWTSTATSVGGQRIFLQGVAGTTEIGINYNATKFDIDINNVTRFSYTYAISAGQWYHIALVRRSTNVYELFVNGTSQGTNTYTYSQNANNFIIGGLTWASNYGIDGYISNVRILKGTALYTSNFTPSTTPLTAIANTSILTCNAPTIVDGSSNNFTITNNGGATVSSVIPFAAASPNNNFQFARRTSTLSGKSVLFNGSNQYLSIPYNSNLWLGSSNWTIECWVYLNSLSTYNNIWEHGYGGSNTIRSIVVYTEQTTGLLRIAQSPDGSTNYDTSLGVTLTTNSWKHVAIVRNGANVTAYLNGTAGTSVTAYNLYNSTTRSHFIGLQGDLQSITAYNGYISNHRVVKGTAVYTSNFTPSTTPLTAIANTALLTCNADTIFDGSSNNFTITNNGGATVSSVSPFVVSSGGMSLKKVFADPIIVYLTQKAIFGYGSTGTVTAITNLVSNTGVVATDTTGVGTARQALAASGYGTDTAIFGYGLTSGNLSMTNLVNNAGVVATDTTGVGTARYGLAAARYGTDKAIFGYGYDATNNLSMTNLVNNTGVVAIDTTGVGTARRYPAAAGYGTDKAIFGYGNSGTNTPTAITNLVSNNGVVATDTTGVGTARILSSAASYGTDKAIFGYGYNGNVTYYSVTNLVSNTGVVATDTTGVGTARRNLAAAGYGGDKAIFGYGTITGGVSGLSMTNLVSNTGVVATDTAGVGTGRYNPAAAGFSLS